MTSTSRTIRGKAREHSLAREREQRNRSREEIKRLYAAEAQEQEADDE